MVYEISSRNRNPLLEYTPSFCLNVLMGSREYRDHTVCNTWPGWPCVLRKEGRKEITSSFFYFCKWRIWGSGPHHQYTGSRAVTLPAPSTTHLEDPFENFACLLWPTGKTENVRTERGKKDEPCICPSVFLWPNGRGVTDEWPPFST